VGLNPIKSIDVFKTLNSTEIRKIELACTPVAEASNYRKELFKTIKNLEVIDSQDQEGEEVDSTIYDEEGDELDDEFEGEEIEDDEFEGEDFESDDDFEEDEEESEKPKKKRN
jgi:hypothetical protein